MYLNSLERPLVNDILAHPAFPSTIWNLKPTQSGKVPVAAGSGGPLNINYETHGTGEIKIVWIMGLGGKMSAWQRQILEFGHMKGDKYSNLILDNRGMGESDKPIMRYSTSDMAKDIIEVLDHLGWTSERQLHIIGISMGGMIAQELAYQIPTRISSLALCSTAARIENTIPFLENLANRVKMFLPKTLDRSITDAAISMFPNSWLDKPDDSILPDSSIPGVLPPKDGGEYQKFNTNYERFAAQEVTKRLNTETFTKKGFMLQAIAAGWHHKSAKQLAEIGDNVGRERILVMHGTKDNMITVQHGHVLIEELKPGASFIREGSGHVIMFEQTEWHNETIEKHILKSETVGNI